MTHLAKVLLISVLCFTDNLAHAQKASDVRLSGIKIFVHDLEIAEKFYTEKLGFVLDTKDESQVILKTNTWPIVLEQSRGKASGNYPQEARTGLSLLTYKLLPRIDFLRSRGIKLYDSLLSRNGVGLSVPFEDPSGNVFTTIEVQIREIQPFNGLQVYNTGITISNMEAAIKFYEGVLGYEEWSRNYLPAALPLKQSDGSLAFMIHYKEGLKKNTNSYGNESQVVLMMEASDLNALKSTLDRENIEFQSIDDRIVCRDPEGNFVEIKASSTP